MMHLILIMHVTSSWNLGSIRLLQHLHAQFRAQLIDLLEAKVDPLQVHIELLFHRFNHFGSDIWHATSPCARRVFYVKLAANLRISSMRKERK